MALRKKPAPKKSEVKKAEVQRQARVEDVASQPFLAAQLKGTNTRGATRAKPRLSPDDLVRRVRELNLKPSVEPQRLLGAVAHINPDAAAPVAKLPEEIRESIAVMRPKTRTFHGAKFSLAYFPQHVVFSPCADKFGYLSSSAIRASTKLPFTAPNEDLLDRLGDLMGDPGRDTTPDSVIPAGFTYMGQFIDHDVTLDVSSSLDVSTDANTINNMRTPALDLDSLYGRGPALDPYLYVFPSVAPLTAIKLQLGSNVADGLGGPGGSAGFGGMKVQKDYDVPRITDPLNLASSSNTAIIGDPRNDENLIVVQIHHAMLSFHNHVVDLLVLANFNGDIFVEAKRIVTQHYQWAVVNDFLKRVCGMPAVTAALASQHPAINSPFRMPVEFAVAAYRFGHSMIRAFYWVNFIKIAMPLDEVFTSNRNPNLPVHSGVVVDFNAFFDTGIAVPVHNKARSIDSVLSPGLAHLPNLAGLMAVLAKRNLRRGLALGLPSGQGMAQFFGFAPLTTAQLLQGLPANEVALLQVNGSVLLTKTPLWYYVLREAAVLGGGNQLGPVGARIVAETFVRMLKRDGGSYLNQPGGFSPFLPALVPGDFTFADLMIFAGVTQP